MEYPNVPENHRTFRPPNRWTAWPLTPDEVPRAIDKFIKKDNLDSYTLRKEQIEWPSRELEEELMGVGLRLAKEKFDKRETESNGDNINEAGSPISGSNIEIDIELNEEEESKFRPMSSSESSEHSNHSHRAINRSQKIIFKPVFSFDDDKSRQILRPSIRHIIVNIEKVLKGLHHSRKAYFSYLDSEYDQEEKPPYTSKLEIRSRGTDQVATSSAQNLQGDFQISPHNSVLQTEESVIHTPHDKASEAEKPRRGRPRKIYERLDGETEREFLVRIARKRKKTIPVFSPLSKPLKPVKTKRIRISRKYKRSATDRLNIRQKKLGLRDWSEVLGVAALIGIPANVIARASQRCVNLFDQSIKYRSMIEGSHINHKADSIIRYRPTTSSGVSSFAHSPTIYPSNLGPRDIESCKSKKPHRHKKFTEQSDLYPMSYSPRVLEGFKDQNEPTGNLKNCHEKDDDQVLNFVLPSHEEMDGAIHIDGFLKCIPFKANKKNKFKKPQKTKRTNVCIREKLGDVEPSNNSDLTHDGSE